jgi:hypothetical protein
MILSGLLLAPGMATLWTAWPSSPRPDGCGVEAYNNLPEFIIFIHEHPLELVAVNGNLNSDNQKRVEDQQKIYGT